MFYVSPGYITSRKWKLLFKRKKCVIRKKFGWQCWERKQFEETHQSNDIWDWSLDHRFSVDLSNIFIFSIIFFKLVRHSAPLLHDHNNMTHFLSILFFFQRIRIFFLFHLTEYQRLWLLFLSFSTRTVLNWFHEPFADCFKSSVSQIWTS